MKNFLFLLLILSPRLFACQGYLDDYNSDKRQAREISEASIVITGGFSFLGPIAAFVASGVTAVSAKLFDDRAESNLRKYEHCINERRYEEAQLHRQQSSSNAKFELEKAKEIFEDD